MITPTVETARICHPYSAVMQAIDKDLRGSLLWVSDPINPPRICGC
jgi:hypothetical protein